MSVRSVDRYHTPTNEAVFLVCIGTNPLQVICWWVQDNYTTSHCLDPWPGQDSGQSDVHDPRTTETISSRPGYGVLEGRVSWLLSPSTTWMQIQPQWANGNLASGSTRYYRVVFMIYKILSCWAQSNSSLPAVVHTRMKVKFEDIDS